MNLLRKKPLFSAMIFLMAVLWGCTGPAPKQEDYYGLYTIIKVRENGIILNIDILSQIELTEELFISAIDRNEDHLISEDEISAVAYEFYLDENSNPFLKINIDETPVGLLSEQHFDLLLKKIDPLGNESIIYLKK